MFRKKEAPEKTDQNDSALVRYQSLALPDRVAEHEDYYRVDDLYCRSLVAYVLPEWLRVGFFNNAVSLGGVTVAVQIIPYGRQQASDKRVARRFAQVGAQIIEAQKSGNTTRLAAMEDKHGYLQQLLKDISLRRDNVVAVQVTINVTAHSLAELREKTLKVKDVLGSCGVRTMYCRQVQGFLHSLPHRLVTLPEFHDVTMAGAVCLAPFITTDFSHPSGIYFGENLSGTPAFLDLFAGPPYLSGAHMFISGIIRSGKSVTAKGITARSAAEGIRVVIFDPEGEYRRLVTVLGGVFVRFSTNMEVMFNIFDIEPEWDRDTDTYYVDLAEKQEDIVNIFSTMLLVNTGEKMSAADRALAGEAVRLEYQARGIGKDPDNLYHPGGRHTAEGYLAGRSLKEMPTLTSYVQRLRDMGLGHLAGVMTPYLAGNPQGFFDGQSIGRFYDAPIVCFDLSAITSEFTRTYCMYVLLAWVWEKFVKKDRKQRKRVVVDEAWLFAKYPDTAIFLEQMARRGAKYNTSLMLATQSFYEFTSKEGRSVLDQCDTKFFLRMKPTEAEAVSAMFHLPLDVVRRMQTFGPGQGLLMAGNEAAVVNFRGLDFEWEFLESNPEKMK